MGSPRPHTSPERERWDRPVRIQARSVSDGIAPSAYKPGARAMGSALPPADNTLKNFPHGLLG